jgi:metal-responsive CopG/Arc/MetJ family transcriptional regulator
LGVKTAISIPDDLFERADAAAASMGVSRSELYRRAVAEYLRRHQDQDVTAKLNEVYADVDSSLDPDVAAAQFATLEREDW